MNREEYESLKDVDPEIAMIDIDMLEDKSDRTLIYGYTCDRRDFHVFIDFGMIHVFVYGDGYPLREDYYASDYKYEPQELVPDKRIYPEACDFEFCKLLKKFNIPLCFTSWNNVPDKPKGGYYGRTSRYSC